VKRLNILFIILGLFVAHSLQAQQEKKDTVIFGGKKMLRIITAKGDTLYLDQLDEVTISSRKQFNSKDEYDLYMRYRRYAAIVYPYAMEAMRIYHDSQEMTKGMSRRRAKTICGKL